MKRALSILLPLLLVLAACDEKPQVVPLSDIISLTIPDYATLSAAKKVRADGATQLKLVATLPGDAGADNRVVTFKSSLGSFNTTGSTTSQIDVLALPTSDGHFEATTMLTLGTVSGDYTVTALIKNKPDYKQDQVITVLPINISDLLTISIDNFAALVAGNLLKADGAMRIKLVAALPPTTLNDDRQVVFTSSAGAFDVTDANKLTKTVTAILQRPTDDHLEAWAYLTLGTVAGNYTVSAKLNSKPLYNSDIIFAVQALKVDDVLQLSFNPGTGLRADGASLLKISTAVTGVPLTHNVTLSVSDGALSGSSDPKNTTLSLSPSGTADQYLLADNDPKTYLITARISDLNLTLTKSYIVSRANPDDIVLEPASLSVDRAGSGTQFNMYLKRAIGTVSPGTTVGVRAYQTAANNTQTSVGRFTGSANGSDSTGKITMTYLADSGTFDTSKPVVIEVTGTNDAGNTFIRQFSLTVK